MNQTLKKAYDALTARIKTLKDDLEKHVESFVSKLDTEKGVVKGDTDELIRLQKHMDTFFRRHTTPFLVLPAKKPRSFFARFYVIAQGQPDLPASAAKAKGCLCQKENAKK